MIHTIQFRIYCGKVNRCCSCESGFWLLIGNIYKNFMLNLRLVQVITVELAEGGYLPICLPDRQLEDQALDLEMTIFSWSSIFKAGTWLFIALFYCNRF